MNLSSLTLESNPITAQQRSFYGRTIRTCAGSHLLHLHHRKDAVFSVKSVASSSSSPSAVAAEQVSQGLSRIRSLSQVSGVLGCQWGDEGKGKLVDILAKHFDIVARCQVKAYTTRVGSGPFPTEILGKGGDLLRFAGQEFGTTTGRPRRCGWLDVVALKYCCQINGFSSLNLTKLDVLSDLPEIQLGVLYKHADGTPVKSFPGDLRVLEQLKVEYEVLLGWQCDISKVRNYSDLPKAAREYVERIEELVGIPIHYIGVGPGRDALIYK
ncbi:hypothetical protein CsSME_00025237 [Camellia sinensis var. sinensis]